ncbi:hypothetical protein FF098_017015 [Parvularcula flava]|uniref:Uncharacterized protein n=1 Tax=Aquisalinus luteolus TaxID=1566827 RepID=A0A8J3A9I1_9PROT|nr:hypothetical protein [Aquisalinus luteolus]NHK29611.1 hypothetical protein [Aquisalinus luteolus]GGI01414.1 hypothetical protein GCM10011355_32000 [Aquisalinus luteolus]
MAARRPHPVLVTLGYVTIALLFLAYVGVPVGIATGVMMWARGDEFGPLSLENWRTIATVGGGCLFIYAMFHLTTWLGHRLFPKSSLLTTFASWAILTGFCSLLFIFLHLSLGLLPDADPVVEVASIALINGILAIVALVHYAITLGVDEIIGR